MKIHKRSKVAVISYFLLFITASFFISCKKQEPQKFSADSFLYFANQYGVYYAPTIQTLYKPVLEFSFLIPAYQMDTLAMNTPQSFPLSIQFDGKVSDKKRMIKLELEGNGKEYCVLPVADSMYIPANGVEYKFNLKIARPPLSDTSTKIITLTLKNTSDFSPEAHIWHTVTYKFGNWFQKPATYDKVQLTYGDFSPAKMYTMGLATNRAGADYWKADANVITLNNFLKNLNQKRVVKFDPFTYDELYFFMDYPLLMISYYRPPEAILNAYNAITAKMIQLSNAVIKERREAGEPILDGSGNEISFP